MDFLNTQRGLRPKVLEKYLKEVQLPTDKINELIQLVWEDAEFPDEQRAVWKRLLNKYTESHFIKEPIRVYRGGTNAQGFSWTTDLDMAKWFARRTLGFEQVYWRERFGMEYHMGTRVYSALANPKSVVFTTNERLENEVVVKTWRKGCWIEDPIIVDTYK